MCKVTISLFQMMQKFPDNESARVYLENQRWQGKPICPKCGCDQNQHKQSRDGVSGYYRCYHCKRVYTIRTGTIFERSHIPLNKWLIAIYMIVTARKGISAIQLSKELGLTEKSAWFMMHRIRHACGIYDGLLSGIIEADETYIGGKEKNKHANKKLKAGRGAVGKAIVFGMKQRNGNVIGKVLQSTDKETIHQQLNQHIAADSVLCTDEHRSYTNNQFDHKIVNHSAKQFVDGMAHTNNIENVWSMLKRGFYGIYHSFSQKHLQRYVNEFTFRLNEGRVEFHTLDRIEALLGKAFMVRIDYKGLVA